MGLILVIQTQHVQILLEALHVRVMRAIMAMDHHVQKINVLAVMVLQLMVQIVLQMVIHLVVPVMVGMF
jgi:hypothetical protein